MPEEDDHEYDSGEEVGSFEEFITPVSVWYQFTRRLSFVYARWLAYRIGPQDAKVSHA